MGTEENGVEGIADIKELELDNLKFKMKSGKGKKPSKQERKNLKQKRKIKKFNSWK